MQFEGWTDAQSYSFTTIIFAVQSLLSSRCWDDKTHFDWHQMLILRRHNLWYDIGALFVKNVSVLLKLKLAKWLWAYLSPTWDEVPECTR